MPLRRPCGRRFGRLRFTQQAAGHAQGALGLFYVDRFGQHQVGSQAECPRDCSLAFNQRDCQRTVIQFRIACAFEQQGGILLVIAIDDQSLKVVRGQQFDCGEGFAARFHRKFQFAENSGHHGSGFLVRTKQQCSIAHTGPS